MTRQIKTENTCTFGPFGGFILQEKKCIRIFIGALFAFLGGGGWKSSQKEKRKGWRRKEESEGQKQGKERNPEKTCVSLNRKLFNKMQCMQILDFHINIKGMNSSYIY